MSTPGTVESEYSFEHREIFARWKWVGLIVGLLAVQILVGGMAIFLANSDPAHSVIPNYYQQALEYDKVLAARQVSHQLGWKWNVVPGESIDLAGKRTLIIQVQDRKSQPVTDALVMAQLWHHARGNQRQSITFDAVPDKPGWYQGVAVVDRNGLWQVDLTVDRLTDHFVDRRETNWSLSKR